MWTSVQMTCSRCSLGVLPARCSRSCSTAVSLGRTDPDAADHAVLLMPVVAALIWKAADVLVAVRDLSTRWLNFLVSARRVHLRPSAGVDRHGPRLAGGRRLVLIMLAGLQSQPSDISRRPASMALPHRHLPAADPAHLRRYLSSARCSARFTSSRRSTRSTS